MRENYSPRILEHYRNPRNFGKLKNATHMAEVLNPLCGDEIKVYMRIEKGVVKDLKYEARGCALSIASASVLSERITNQELGIKDLNRIGKEEIQKALGITASRAREQCVLLILNAVKKAIIQNS